MIKALAVIFCANITAEDKINTIVDDVDKIAENNENIIDVKNYIDLNNLIMYGLHNSQCNNQYNIQYNFNSVLEQNSSNTKINSKI